MRIILVFSFIIQLLVCNLNGQTHPFQSMKGRVLEQSIKTPVSAATIVLLGKEERTFLSDANGNFRIPQIPVGRISMLITHIGFKPLHINNLLLESGKELVLNVELEEDHSVHKEIIIKMHRSKSNPINDFAMISARMFNADQIRRFAAGLNDPSRIASNFAGVASAGDGNSLIIRGNAPNGMLWRLEGVDVPNPNHFARVGTSGGAISILSAQLLSHADFITGAFPAEYGNALSGVFDIHLRKGNNSKREHTFSLSTIGIDFATEGCFKKGYNGSYLINYRYGFLSLMQKIGFKISDDPTTFQDLSFNIHLPTNKLGSFSFFGFGGLSKQYSLLATDASTWNNNPSSRSSFLNAANTGAAGISHQLHVGKNIFWRTVISKNGYLYRDEDKKLDAFGSPVLFTRINKFSEWNSQLSSVLTYKINKHHLLKAGMYSKNISFDLHQREALNNVLKDKIHNNGSTVLHNYFLQWKWNASNRFSFQFGMHGQYFNLNRTKALQPRLGMKYQVTDNQYLSIGYGQHAQIQPLGNYFARIKMGTDTVMPNKNLDLSKSNHYMLGYSVQLANDWNLKSELYFQWLHDIPIHALKMSNYSVINLDDDFSIETLVNKGLGRNYGLEFTLERYWNDRFYLLGTLSLYQSEYRPSDLIWRSTKYNSNRSGTLLIGKEWVLKSRRPTYLGIDLKLISMGGVRVTPIDLIESIRRKTTVYIISRYYDEKLKSIFRVDAQFEWKVQYKKKTGSLIVGVQNATNRKNPISQRFDATLGKIAYSYLLGRIPVFGYKVDF